MVDQGVHKRHGGKETAKNFTAGAMGAMIARGVCQPLDVMKVRLQLYPNKYRSLSHAITDMYQQKGIRGLWTGHAIAQASGLVQGGVQFFLFEQLSYTLTVEPLTSMPNTKNFVCGFLTGTLGVLLVSPFEVVKTRLIAQEKGKQISAFNTVTGLYHTDGIRGVYKGAFTAMLQVGPLIGSRFMVYNFFCNLAMRITEHKKKSDLPAIILLLAGGSAGIISNVVTYPMDVVKRRMQIHGFKHGLVASCNKIVTCIVTTVTEHGYRGLFTGMSPTLLRSAITAGLTFSAFDKIRALLNKLDGTG